MTPEDSTALHREVRDGIRAEKTLNDPGLTKAFNDVEQAITDRWAASPVNDRDGQYTLRLMLKLLGDVRANLEQAVSDGNLAAEALKIEQQRESSVQKLRKLFR